ncbi:MAG: PD-(D/E)XK nuclease family protein [bacterium]|nr:PD-(D/E)XK nuclease family protein [bacterium]
MPTATGAKSANGKRSRNIYDPAAKTPFKLSRSKLENFTRCARCFYLDRRLGVGEPSGPPFTLNTAVDALLKKEFDVHRAMGTTHPLMRAYGIDAVPYQHKDLNAWRENFVGVQYHHAPTNFIITGAVDDIWINPKGELHVVDYKATSSDHEVTLDSEYRQAYKRQMEIYQWLLRQNSFDVSDMGYFVYANGRKDLKAFDGKLEFNVKILSYAGNDGWVEKTIVAAHRCLVADAMPAPAPTCAFCAYRKAAREVE